MKRNADLSGSDTRERIAIVYPWTNVDTVPSLCNAAELLADKGYKVEIFCPIEPTFLTPIFNHPLIEVVVCGSRRERNGIYRFIPRRWSYPLQVLQRHRQSPYRCFFGVDPQGLLQAESFSRFTKAPLIYYSLELFLSGELSNENQAQLKRKEIELSRNAALVIIQDEERARLLSVDNAIAIDRFALVPNAPLGPARRNPSCYWHQRFELSADRRIALHAGSVGKWTGLDEIVKSVWSWPKNWVLVVHARFRAQSNGEIERLQRLAVPGRVFFSLEPASRQDYDMMVNGADIGIAFYRPVDGSTYTQRNIQTIGLSSGKIAYYLRAGLPVIVNKWSSVSELLWRERCGICVQHGPGISKAIARIANNYQEYSQRACATFDQYFEFSRAFEEVIRRIDSLRKRES